MAAALGTLRLLVAFLPAAPARAQTELPSELTTVADVRFEGVKHVREKELDAVLKTHKSSRLLGRERPLLRVDFLRADIAAIEDVYHQHGYLDAAASYELTPTHDHGAVIVRFKIIEGRRIHIDLVELEGVTVLPKDPLRRSLFARKKRPFNPYYLVADTAKIAEAYKDRGYFPTVHARTERHDFSMAVRYVVAEGPRYHFGDVRVANLDQLTVSEHFVRRELLIKPDAIYRSSRVQQSIERLYETGMFSQVQMTPLIDSTATKVDFELALRERRPRWVDAGIGSGTSERLLATAEWGHRNLLRNGRQGALTGRLALDGQARFLLSRIEGSVLEPWLFATRTRGLLTLYYENHHDRTNPKVITETQSQGGSFQVQRQLGRYTRIALTQDNTFVRQSQTFIDPTISPHERDSLSSEITPKFTTHRLQLGLDRDTRDNPVQMTRGSYQAYTSDVAGGPLRGASSFTKNHLASAWYTQLRPGWVLATQARGGIIRPFGRAVIFSNLPGIDPEVARVPVLDLFKLGGVNSVRGYDEGQIPAPGGLALLQANAELRLEVRGPVGIEAYVDAGNVWARAEDVRHGSFSPRGGPLGANDVRWAFGVGPRLQLPFGPLRADFTWWPRLDRQLADAGHPDGKRARGRFQFAIGPAF